MTFKRNKSAPAREACMDDSLLNLLLVITAVILLFAIMLSVYFTVALVSRENPTEDETSDTPASADGDFPFRVEGITIDLPHKEDSKNTIGNDVLSSEKAILVDITANEIVASRQCEEIIYPASMTKVMTLVVVVENLKSEDSLDEVLEITHEYGENSGLVYPKGTKLTVKDLIHAAMLQSDGIACITLAEYVAGSEANFVKLMNEKAAELGIGDTTLFQNCTGLYHQYHYSTCRDIATIMAYAMKNPLCSSVLTAQVYQSERAGKFYHALFSPNYLYTKQPNNANIISGKTGFTEKDTSGFCIVTYAKGDNGHYYVSVTAKAESWATNVQDILTIYNEYVK